MRVGSLFSGIGGFDLALERAGMECAWQVEIDPKCLELLETRWPGVQRYGDITTVGAADLAGVDLVCGGFPCQDLSVAGRRAGLAGERSGLWFEFHRVLAEVRPSWCLIENVPGLLSSRGGKDFAVILRGLVELGYGVAWRVFDAQYFGVAQRRRRVFIVGHIGDGSAAEVLFKSEGLSWNPPARGEAGEEVAGSLGGSSQNGGFRTTDLDNQGAFIVPDVSAPLRSRQMSEGVSMPGRGGEDDENPVAYPDPAYSVQGNGTRFGSGQRNQDTFVVAGTVTGAEAHNGNSNPIADNLVIAGPVAGGAYGSGRRSEDDPNLVLARPLAASRTTDHYDESQQTYVPTRGSVRRLTPTEAERLQGFPDGWTAAFSDSTRYRMLGNAIAVPVAEWIGRQIMAVAEVAHD